MEHKKIGIITIHYGINYGSVLQTYATTKYLKDKNCIPEVINYIPKRYSRKIIYTMAPKNKNIVYKIIYIIAAFPHRFINRIKFKKFLKNNIKLTKECSEFSVLEKTAEKYDALIAGSDQIWNSDYNKMVDRAYYLDFNNNSYKYALSGSFGKNQLAEEEKESTKEKLKNFNYITTRENTGLNICKELGFKNVEQTLDPTFLLNKEEWNKCWNRKLPIKNDKYLLMYVMDSEYEKILNIASRISKEKNLKIYLISFRKQKDKRIDKSFNIISPELFIKLFYNAEYVVTNSFHGVAFSINFNKQFIAVSREKYNTRLESILELFNLKSRLVDINETNINFKDIDYKKTCKLIEEERQNLYNCLENNLLKRIEKND